MATTLQFGSLPLVLTAKNKQERLQAYTRVFLKEEIQAEALVRNLRGFVRFLPIAALYNGQVLNRASLARDAAIGRMTVEDYFAILEACYQGFYLPGYQAKIRVRERQAPKWIWTDPGIVRTFQERSGVLSPVEKDLLFETWILTQIKARNEMGNQLFDKMNYWSSIEGKRVEVDCLLQRGNEFWAIEIKASERFRPDMLYGLQAISALEGVKRRILVYCGTKDLRTADGIDILSLETFLTSLTKGFT